MKHDQPSLSLVASGIAAPFTVESFRQDIVEVFFHYIRTVGTMMDRSPGPDKAWQLIKEGAAPEGFYSPEYTASDLGVTYTDISQTLFAEVLEKAYQLAYLGKLDLSGESPEPGGAFARVATIVNDLAHSDLANEWEAFGGVIIGSARRCLRVIETANARSMLEGGESFCPFLHPSRRDDELEDQGMLTVAQMALLSGMEEMSIRAAANPKRANPLKTVSEQGRTRIQIEVAKLWLQRKGLYTPLTKFRSEGQVDLASHSFDSLNTLATALSAHLLTLKAADPKLFTPNVLESLGIVVRGNDEPLGSIIPSTVFSNDEQLKQLAELLGLSPELLALRCKELTLKNQLSEIDKQITILSSTTHSAK